MRCGHWAAVGVVALLLGTPAAKGQLFSQDFEADSTSMWTVNEGPSDQAANFFFDYSTVGIPSAPSGSGTRGMKLQANLSDGLFSGFSVSPTGLDLSGDYRVSFDWWANYNGPFPAGGNGSTNLSTFGIGTSGTETQRPGVVDSLLFAATGDGNTAADYRAYSPAEPSGYTDGSAVYAAATRDSSDPYYAGFGNVTAPAAQLALFPQQSGSTGVGAAGMEWHTVEINKFGEAVTWHIDGLLIATVDLNTVILGGGNIFFGHSDTNASASVDPNDIHLLFTLIDNIIVVPAPGVMPLLAVGLLPMVRRGSRSLAHGC